LVRQGLPAERIYRIGNFVEIPPPTPKEKLRALRRSLGIDEEALVVFSLGRFIAVKGFDDLLAAFARLPAKMGGRPVELLIAGDGPLGKPLRAQAESLSLGNRVHWLGWQDSPSFYYHLADLFVCPSRHETLGNVLLEAWAHHLPVVSTRTPGALELIRDGQNGLLVPCQDPSRLAGILQDLLETNDLLRKSLAEKGRSTLEAHHSEGAVVDAYMALYSALEAKRP
jgi:glycosyltransferase involved in cell wall biosynthesis